MTTGTLIPYQVTNVMIPAEPKTQFRPGATLSLREASPALPPASVPPSALEAVRMAVQRLDRDRCALRPASPPDRGLAFQPQSLLATILYCYLHDIYGSEDIEDALRRDGGFRALCQQEFPDAATLRRFRRWNRSILQQTLQAALALIHGEVADAALAEEASRRIAKATFIDSMGFED
jgi:hypothetical protein